MDKYEKEVDELFASAKGVDGEYYILKILSEYGRLIRGRFRDEY